MLHIDVSVPELGEVVELEGGQTLLGDEKSVTMVLADETGPVCAAQMPAKRAMALSQQLYTAARKADPDGTSFGAILRASVTGNA